MQQKATEKIRLAVLCGGVSAEHEVSLQSARNIVAAVDRCKFDLTLIGIDRQGQWLRHDPDNFLVHPESPAEVALRPDGQPVAAMRRGDGTFFITTAGDAERVDVVFPVLHGTCGEDGAVQGFFRMLQTAVVGCDLAGSAVCMDKDLTKKMLQAAGLPVAAAQVLTRNQRPQFDPGEAIAALGLPIFVKPARLGSSVGISKAKSRGALLQAVDNALLYDSKVLLEAFVAGREIECAVLGNNDPEVSVPGEIVPLGEFYSYKAKYIDDNGAELKAPADLSVAARDRLQHLAIRSFQAAGCRGMARVDMFLSDTGEIHVNEINTIPGFTRISMYPRLWSLSGYSYPQLVEKLINLALDAECEERKLLTNLQM